MNHQKDCQDRREAIVALVLGELEAPAVDELKQHLETCPACREFYQELTTEEEMIISGFGTLADRAGVNEDRLIKQLEEQSQSEKPITSGPAFGGRLWKGIKTMPKISKIAASIIVALGVIGVIALFTHTGSNLAFADVLSHVQQSDPRKGRRRTGFRSNFILREKCGWITKLGVSSVG